MPATFYIDTETGVIHTTVTGLLSLADLSELKHRLVEHADFRPDLVELSDATAIKGLDFSPSAVGSLADQDRAVMDRLGPDYKLAIVIADDLVFDMGRGYEFLSTRGGPEVRVFRDMGFARDWLGIEPSV